VVFYENHQNSVREAWRARELSVDLVNAQPSRRSLDFLVDSTSLPLLWKRCARVLAAGRGQSPALR